MVQFVTNASGAIWWPNLQPMHVAPSGGQIWNLCKWRHLVNNFATNANCATWWSKLEPMLIFSWRDNSSYRCNTLGSFCIQQCFYSWVQQIQSKTVILALCPQRFPLLHHHPFGIPTIVCIPTYSRPLLAFPKHEHSEKWGSVRCASVEYPRKINIS